MLLFPPEGEIVSHCAVNRVNNVQVATLPSLSIWMSLGVLDTDTNGRWPILGLCLKLELHLAGSPNNRIFYFPGRREKEKAPESIFVPLS